MSANLPTTNLITRFPRRPDVRGAKRRAEAEAEAAAAGAAA